METFLHTFAETANVMLSARAANIARATVYYWLEHDVDDFSKRYNVADQEANDRIEAEIHRRGIVGVDKPVYYKGEIVGHIREWSDNLLMFRAKARMNKYRDRVEHTGPDGGPIQVEDARERLAAKLATMADRRSRSDNGN